MPLTCSPCEGAGRRNRRASVYVDKILKGAEPGDLLIEMPTKVDLVRNNSSRARGYPGPDYRSPTPQARARGAQHALDLAVLLRKSHLAARPTAKHTPNRHRGGNLPLLVTVEPSMYVSFRYYELMKLTLTGAKLASFPLGLPTKVGVLHHLPTAGAMGLAIPQSRLRRVDGVMK